MYKGNRLDLAYYYCRKIRQLPIGSQKASKRAKIQGWELAADLGSVGYVKPDKKGNIEAEFLKHFVVNTHNLFLMRIWNRRYNRLCGRDIQQ